MRLLHFLTAGRQAAGRRKPAALTLALEWSIAGTDPTVYEMAVWSTLYKAASISSIYWAPHDSSGMTHTLRRINIGTLPIVKLLYFLTVCACIRQEVTDHQICPTPTTWYKTSANQSAFLQTPSIFEQTLNTLQRGHGLPKGRRATCPIIPPMIIAKPGAGAGISCGIRR